MDQQQNASISGKVVNDANGNGVDNSEAGLAGADVKLFRDTSSPFGTLDGGDTQFGTTPTTTGTCALTLPGALPISYFVTETNPSGFGSTAAIAGTNGASVVTSKQINVVLAAGASGTGNV